MTFGAELIVTGNVVTAPTLTYTRDGRARVTFTILSTRTWTDKGGDRRETKAHFPVAAWGSLAENAGASLSKGDRVLVWGRLEEHTWEDDHRQEHTQLQLTASEIGPLIFAGPVTVIRNPRRDEGAAVAPASRPAPRGNYDDEEPF